MDKSHESRRRAKQLAEPPREAERLIESAVRLARFHAATCKGTASAIVTTLREHGYTIVKRD